MLAILTVAFAVTAQSLRYFTIQVNGSDEWTPFPGKTGVTFEVENEPNSKENIKNILSFSNDGKTIRFTGKQVGEASITATLGDQKTFAWVYVRGMEVDEQKTKINYHYNPPKDNYHIKVEYYKDNGSPDISYTHARIGKTYAYRIDDHNKHYTLFYLYSDVNGMGYEWDSKKGRWQIYGGNSNTDDGKWLYNEFQEEKKERNGYDPISGIDNFDDIFMSVFRFWNFDADKINNHYIGDETLYPAPHEKTGIKCNQLIGKKMNAIEGRWWVDTKNGCCLQISKEDGSNIWFKVTDYNLDYTEWTNDVMPGKLK